MDKRTWGHCVVDDNYLMWVIKMILGALLTPLWIILQTFGIEYDFN